MSNIIKGISNYSPTGAGTDRLGYYTLSQPKQIEINGLALELLTPPVLRAIRKECFNKMLEWATPRMFGESFRRYKNYMPHKTTNIIYSANELVTSVRVNSHISDFIGGMGYRYSISFIPNIAIKHDYKVPHTDVYSINSYTISGAVNSPNLKGTAAIPALLVKLQEPIPSPVIVGVDDTLFAWDVGFFTECDLWE